MRDSFFAATCRGQAELADQMDSISESERGAFALLAMRISKTGASLHPSDFGKRLFAKL